MTNRPLFPMTKHDRCPRPFYNAIILDLFISHLFLSYRDSFLNVLKNSYTSSFIKYNFVNLSIFCLLSKPTIFSLPGLAIFRVVMNFPAFVVFRVPQ